MDLWLSAVALSRIMSSTKLILINLLLLLSIFRYVHNSYTFRTGSRDMLEVLKLLQCIPVVQRAVTALSSFSVYLRVIIPFRCSNCQKRQSPLSITKIEHLTKAVFARHHLPSLGTGKRIKLIIDRDGKFIHSISNWQQVRRKGFAPWHTVGRDDMLSSGTYVTECKGLQIIFSYR